MEQVQVWRRAHADPAPLFGPLPGIRHGDTLAYEFQLPDSFVPWPGRTLLERVFVLLDLGVSMSIPAWQSYATTDRTKAGPTTWYVDLVRISTSQDSITVRDLYIDVMVRWQRFLDRYLHALGSPLGPIITAPG